MSENDINEDNRVMLEAVDSAGVERITAGIAMLDTLLEVVDEEKDLTLEGLVGTMLQMRTILGAFLTYKMQQENGE